MHKSPNIVLSIPSVLYLEMVIIIVNVVLFSRFFMILRTPIC